MDPKGKVALITGGARIGKSVAEALARRGCDVVLTFRSSREAAEEAAETVRQAGARAVTVQADLSVEGSAAAVIDEADRRFGRLDILINMASLYRKVPFEKLNLAAWQSSLSVDLQGSYLFSLKAVPLMRRHGAGRIINFSDWVAASGRPRYKQFTPYYVWKRGILGLTESLALELAPDILVNAVAPGPILPPPDMTPEENEEVKMATPLKRWGGGEEIAKAVLFLIETDFVTGECIRIDGGRHLY
jgi:NAD(P)-dependent dehydrogenase (short-subunit alcohol dehydrogenase family)